MPVAAFDMQGITSYWCSIVILNLDGTVVELQTVIQLTQNPNKKNEKKVAGYLLS